jgi:hypothetical protein
VENSQIEARFPVFKGNWVGAFSVGHVWRKSGILSRHWVEAFVRAKQGHVTLSTDLKKEILGNLLLKEIGKAMKCLEASLVSGGCIHELFDKYARGELAGRLNEIRLSVWIQDQKNNQNSIIPSASMGHRIPSLKTLEFVLKHRLVEKPSLDELLTLS